jgi:hypothetical protein
VDFDMGRLWWRRTPHPVAASSPAWRGSAAYGAFIALAAGSFFHYIPGPPRGPDAVPVTSGAHTAASFHQVVLPDLAVTEPAGVSASDLTAISKVHGVRQVLALDGASVSMGASQVNVVGVNPQLFRSWTPLSTASNQALWNSLAAGGFLATPHLRHKLRLQQGLRYPVSGATTVSLPFAGAASLGVGGIDLVVSNTVSARLGLVHNVAALISAPSLSIRKLRREIGAVAGPAARLVTLRQQSPASTPLKATTSDKKPTTYVQLFQESAAMYCPGLPWTVLAAIGQIESGDGANTGPSTAGALGPMQFLPSTWAEWGVSAFGEPGPPNIMDPYDAVPSAARYLCAAGGSTSAGLSRAIFAYNHAGWYVSEVLALAGEYAQAYR